MLSPSPEMKVLLVLAKISRKIEIEFSGSAVFHVKIRVVSNILWMIADLKMDFHHKLTHLFFFLIAKFISSCEMKYSTHSRMIQLTQLAFKSATLNDNVLCRNIEKCWF